MTGRPTKEEIDQHIAMCTDGETCSFKKARAWAALVAKKEHTDEATDLAIALSLAESDYLSLLEANTMMRNILGALVRRHGGPLVVEDNEIRNDGMLTLQEVDNGVELIFVPETPSNERRN